MRELREKQGLTQAELAEKIGLTTNGYAKIERNETMPQAESIKKIAQVLGVNMEMLMHDNEDIKNIVILSDNTTSENSVTVGIKNVSCNGEEQINLLKQIIDEKDKRIKHLEDLIELLKNKS